VKFPNGQTAKLFYFIEEKDRVRLPHYICICPSLQNDGGELRICMLDKRQVYTELENYDGKEGVINDQNLYYKVSKLWRRT
jgi:hypothetical protein